MPSEVLSNRGRAFLSSLMKEVQQLLGLRKTNTTAYHPQTDGLVERFNRTLTSMLAKTGGRRKILGPETTVHPIHPQQQSTLESPFFLLYGRDPRLPTDTILSPAKKRKTVDLKEYGLQLVSDMTEAWELARQHNSKAQKRQKEYYDGRGKAPNFQVGLFLYRPADTTGEARKFARPYHGPFRIVEVDSNTARIQRVDRPEEDSIHVSMGRLRRCPSEAPDRFWPPDKSRPRRRRRVTKNVASTPRDGNADIILNTVAEDCERESHPTHPESARQECLPTDSTGDAVAVIPGGDGSAGWTRIERGTNRWGMRMSRVDLRILPWLQWKRMFRTLRSGLRQPRTSDIQAGEM